jgi:thiol-disulfide isomerase/thioredoxin
MKRAVIIFGFLLLTFQALHAQNWLIRGTIEDAAEGPVVLASFYGDRFRVMDSMYTESGSFYFMLPDDTPPGTFRIIYSDTMEGIRNQNRFVEFIFNREDIELVVASSEKGPVPYFENSLENLVYGEFMDFELGYEERVMSEYTKLYPRREGSNEDAVERYNAIQMEREHYMDSIAMRYPDLYSVRIINAFRAPFIPGEISHLERIDTLKECFFDRSAIDDPELLYAPVYTFKLIDYLSLYKVDTLTQQQQEEEFIEAVDRIMVNVSGEGELREFVVEFLLEGFELLGMEQVQMHLAENYLDESCESDIVELVLSRMEGYKQMVPGKEAPDIILRDVKGLTYQLSELGRSYVLVLFWSSTCGHCHDLLPQLHEWYQNENSHDLEVMAISIDSSVANFEQVIAQEDFPWIVAHDPLGWQGRTPADYHVYATPTLYLLDRERTILARPANFRQFVRTMKKLED